MNSKSILFSINGMSFDKEDFIKIIKSNDYPLSEDFWTKSNQNEFINAVGHDEKHVYVISAKNEIEINKILKFSEKRKEININTICPIVSKPATGIFEPHILELKKRLDELKIPYEVYSILDNDDQLKFEWCNADIICHRLSYGGQDGLFEIMGDKLMTKDELSDDNVVGYITLGEAIMRIKKAWEKHSARPPRPESTR